MFKNRIQWQNNQVARFWLLKEPNRKWGSGLCQPHRCMKIKFAGETKRGKRMFHSVCSNAKSCSKWL